MAYRFILPLLLASVSLFGESDELEQLLEGNKRFMNGNLLHPNRTLERRKGTVAGQEPFAVIVSCSDSRVRGCRHDLAPFLLRYFGSD